MAAATGNYVGASINYRLTDEAAWPAQIHDCKAAIRWLRANAAKYHIDPERIGVIGSSAGGHLVAMLGVTGGVEALEGSLGEHSGVSSRVACVVDLYGPTDLTDMPEREARRPGSPVAKLVGGPVQDRRETAREASPVTYVSSDDPPMLIIHGTADPTVPFDQSTRLEKALKAAGVSVLLVPVTDGVHGRFNTPEFPRRVQQFFDKQLRGEDIQVSAEPIKAGPEQPAPQK
jgi:acetyl esterase/lipase